MFDQEDTARPAGKLGFADLNLTALPGAWHAWDCVRQDWVQRVLEGAEQRSEKASAAQMRLLLSEDRKIHEIWLNSPWFAFDVDGWLAWFTAPALEALENIRWKR